MDFVCATEQNPPKEVSASIETYFSVWDSMFLDNIGIPLVISSIGRHMFDIKADLPEASAKEITEQKIIGYILRLSLWFRTHP